MMIPRSAARSLSLFKRPRVSHQIATKAHLIEGGALKHYNPELYYPVHTNELFHQRYRTCVKLGYGGYSTVWLCLDETDNSYRALKVGTRRNSKSMTKEAQVLEYLASRNSVHDGRPWLREACDTFQIDVPDGSHTCLVYEALGISLLERIDLQPGKKLELPLVKVATYCLLLGIDYLHSSGVIHTDIKLDNIQEALPEENTEVLTRLVEAERSQSSPQKIEADRATIYTSRSLDYKSGVVYPILTDLARRLLRSTLASPSRTGALACMVAVFGSAEYTHTIQAIPYRAPEVILRMKWNEKVDIWNLGVIVWELLCGEHLFGRYNELDALASMIKYLGPPPAEFLKRSNAHLQYFDEQGNWKGTPLEHTSLKDRLEGGGDIDMFVDFVQPMLSWEPEKRPSAAALLKHPWLQS
ncbi:CMGC/SRPK protein kinase [Pseudogymnoascus sp. 05NY08]|nr:CMGC/SRPK protein kinase [Pseudogymnoascus sp. 05NY08]